MNKFRRSRERKSIRLRGWDYRSSGAYFVTICTKEKQHFLGEIRNGIMGLSHRGIIAHWFWSQIPQHFSHVELDAFIVMPNHIHGILWITDDGNSNYGFNSIQGGDAINRVPTGNDTDLKNKTGNKPIKGGVTGKHNPMNSDGNLGQIIRWYKGRCTYEINRRNLPSFAWQSRFYDHIIRNEKAFNNIQDYIINNPLGWEDDRCY